MAPSSNLVATETSGEVVRTMKVNGRVLQYKAPIPVQESISGHPGQYTLAQLGALNEQHLHPRQLLHPDSVADDKKMERIAATEAENQRT